MAYQAHQMSQHMACEDHQMEQHHMQPQILEPHPSLQPAYSHPHSSHPHSSHPSHSSYPHSSHHSSHHPSSSHAPPPPLHSMDTLYYQDSHMTSMDDQGHQSHHQGHQMRADPHVTYSSVYPPTMMPSPGMGPSSHEAPHAPPHSYPMESECSAQPLDLSTKPRRPDDGPNDFRSISPRDMRDAYNNKHVNVSSSSSSSSLPSAGTRRVSPYGIPPSSRMSSRSPLTRMDSPYYRDQTPSPQSFAAGYSSAYLSSMRASSTPESYGSGSLSSHPLTSSDGVLNGLSGGAYRLYEPMGGDMMRGDEGGSSGRAQTVDDHQQTARLPEQQQQQQQQPLEDEGPKYMDLDSATSNYHLGSRSVIIPGGSHTPINSNSHNTINSNSHDTINSNMATISSSIPHSFSPPAYSPVKSQSVISGKDHCPKSRLVKEHLQKEMEKDRQQTEQISKRAKVSSESPIPPYLSIPYSSRADPTALPNPSNRANPTALPNPSSNRANPTALPNPSSNRANPTALPNPTSNRANPTALPNPSSNRANPTSLPTLPKIQRSRHQATAHRDNRSNVQLDPDSSSDSKQRGKSAQGPQRRDDNNKSTSRLPKGTARQNGSHKSPRAPKGPRAPMKRKSPSPDPSSNGSTGSPASGSPVNHENEDLSNNMGSLATQIPSGKSFINFNLLKPEQIQGDDRIIKRIVDKRKPGDIQVEYFESEGIQKMRMNLLELIAYSVEDVYMGKEHYKERRPSVGLTKA